MLNGRVGAFGYHLQLQQLALRTPRMLKMSRVLQKPACVLVRGRWKAAYETHRRLVLLRAEVKKPPQRGASGQDQKACGRTENVMQRRARRCREAGLRSGCGMLAVEATASAQLLLLLAVRCPARHERLILQTPLAKLPSPNSPRQTPLAKLPSLPSPNSLFSCQRT
jgi:hypothetical protein